MWPPRLNTALFKLLLSFGVLIVLPYVPEFTLGNAERPRVTHFGLAYHSIAYTYANLSLIAAIAMCQVLLANVQSTANEFQERMNWGDYTGAQASRCALC